MNRAGVGAGRPGIAQRPLLGGGTIPPRWTSFGLGMLAALEEAIPLVREHEGVEIDLAHLPPDDPKVYAMLQRADTIGVFQVERPRTPS